MLDNVFLSPWYFYIIDNYLPNTLFSQISKYGSKVAKSSISSNNWFEISSVASTTAKTPETNVSGVFVTGQVLFVISCSLKPECARTAKRKDTKGCGCAAFRDYPYFPSLTYSLIPMIVTSSICSRLPRQLSKCVSRSFICCSIGREALERMSSFSCPYLNFFPFDPPN